MSAQTSVASGRHEAQGEAKAFAGLALGALGVVFGDIGTSPIYSVREALAHAGPGEAGVMGVISLIFWALVLVVTVKYVVVVMRADNKGEGGTLALMALAQHALGRRSALLFVLGICGAAMFYGDGVITPAISVLSAAEGLAAAPQVGRVLAPVVQPAAAGILIALFLVQARGTATVGRWFGPVMLVWFAVLAVLGLGHVVHAPQVLEALSPVHAVRLLAAHGLLSLALLGSVFLAVTGAEALYADMGHFGRAPIRAAWLFAAFPCLMLNYLGQGALVLADPSARADPFFRMIPAAAYWPMMLLTTAATVIASQAVISGAFSMTQQAVQLGFLPRTVIRRTSETVAGQIYAPQVNGLLLAGVLYLLLAYGSSSKLAAAYGIAVTGTMVITVLLMAVVARRLWRWSWLAVTGLAAPFLAIDGVFLTANSLKFMEGGWFPAALALALILVMWTWRRGMRILAAKTRRDALPLLDLIATLEARPPHRSSGTAVFLTSDPQVAPVALMHNLKHNRTLHQTNLIMTVVTADTPRWPEAERVKVEPLNADFQKVTVTYGFMEEPNLPRALAAARRQQGLKFDIMSVSFFLGRRSMSPTAQGGMPLWQDKLFIFLMKNAANPTDFFHIPPGRVVELGSQVAI
jgi:KUP system potassium uptake protein